MNTYDEREALANMPSHVDEKGLRYGRLGYSTADYFLASPVWRNRGRGPITDEEIERVAAAIAKAAEDDYWTDEIAAWENSEQWERDAYPENYPHSAYEDREFYRKQARAALEAARDAEADHA